MLAALFRTTEAPFLDVTYKQNAKGEICFKIDQKPEPDQIKVADPLAHYFSTIADGIGGSNIENLTEEAFWESWV